jgi:putative lipoprotein (rSAM/lipoprotein system)
MKVRFNRWYNTILTALLSLLGYGCSSENSMEMYGSPILMYGVPSAEYKISGTVTDEGGKAVEGIKTSVKQVTNYEGKPITFAIDSVLTDANGHYDMTSTHFPQSPEIKLIVEDVDGDTNGAYQNDTIDINYNNAQKVKDGEGTWNNGTFTIKQDIKLKKK